MPGDVTIQMPTDLRPRKQLEALELDSDHSPHLRRGIIALTVDIPSSHPRQSQPAERPPARWRTPEFLFYALVFIVIVPVMVWIPITLSSGMFVRRGRTELHLMIIE